jgi:hypothetical protein
VLWLPRFLTFTVWGLALIAAPAAASEKYLVHVMERWSRIDLSRIEGGAEGEPVSVTVERTEREGRPALKIEASSSGDSFEPVTLMVDRFSELDLSSAQVFVRSERNGRGVMLELRTSEARDCFINDDGRDRLDVVFSTTEGTRAYRISYENCEVSHEELELRMPTIESQPALPLTLPRRPDRRAAGERRDRH